MASREVNFAVEKFRKVQRAEIRLAELQDELQDAVDHISRANGEFSDYVRLTQEIDDAIDNITEQIEATEWAPTTQRQLLLQAIAHNGLDRNGN